MSEPKRITFLIGNGFDLSCGLKTRYSDSYQKYLDSPALTEQIKMFKDIMRDEITQNIDTWADFEMSLAQHASSFYNKECLFDGLSDYTEFLSDYLTEQNDAFNNLIKNGGQTISGFQMLYQFYKGMPSQTETRFFSDLLEKNFNDYCVLNFNYTNTIDSLLKNNPSPSSNVKNVPVIHVHGTLQEGMILGVNNVEQLNLSVELTEREKRTIVKPFFNQIFDDTKTERAKSRIMGSDVICIYGLSLGESDKLWRDILIEWIESNPEHHIVAYDYQLEGVTTTLANRKLDLCEDSKERFIKHILKQDNEIIRRQIHIPIGQKLFDLRKRIEVIEAFE